MHTSMKYGIKHHEVQAKYSVPTERHNKKKLCKMHKEAVIKLLHESLSVKTEYL